MRQSPIIKEGSVVDQVRIWKAPNLSSDGSDDFIEYMCELTFGKIIIDYMLRDGGELEDDKYTTGIYEYKDGKYIQVENWEE